MRNRELFPGSVQSEDADLCSVEIRKVDVFEDRLLVVVFAHSYHGVDNLVRFTAHMSKTSLLSKVFYDNHYT